MLRQRLKNLYNIGVPYATIARKVGVDNSHISRFANGKGNVSFLLEEKINEAIREFKEAVKNA